MSAQHTPGPWVHHPEDNIISASVRRATLIEWQARSLHVSVEERDANARLIAAAPELLEALKEFVDEHGSHTLTETERLQKARAAIAKATGEAA